MRYRAIGCVFCLCLVGSEFPTDAQTSWTVYLHRAGPIRIGMSLPQVQRILRDPKAFLWGNAPEVPLKECSYLQSNAIPEGLGFMFAGGRVVRIDVFASGVRTSSGARIGATEEKIKQLYPGRITTEPDFYNPEMGHYLNYTPSDASERGYGMVFETDGKTVTHFRTGTIAAIALVEGCS